MSAKLSKGKRLTAGYFLTEALVYISVVFVILGVGYMALHRSINNSLDLRRSADDISAALKAGELWRSDVRQAEKVALVSTEEGPLLTAEGPKGRYSWRQSGKLAMRKVGEGEWVSVLSNVKAFDIGPDPRGDLAPWRLEVELLTRSKTARIKPLFTFTALPKGSELK